MLATIVSNSTTNTSLPSQVSLPMPMPQTTMSDVHSAITSLSTPVTNPPAIQVSKLDFVLRYCWMHNNSLHTQTFLITIYRTYIILYSNPGLLQQHMHLQKRRHTQQKRRRHQYILMVYKLSIPKKRTIRYIQYI